MKKVALVIAPLCLMLTGCEDFDAVCQWYADNYEEVNELMCALIGASM